MRAPVLAVALGGRAWANGEAEGGSTSEISQVCLWWSRSTGLPAARFGTVWKAMRLPVLAAILGKECAWSTELDGGRPKSEAGQMGFW